MVNRARLQEILIQYKQDLAGWQWKNEKFKWEAVKCFQDNWDVNAQDFTEMLTRSLDKTANLLASANNFPKGMMIEFSQQAPEEVRSMFLALYDESKDVYERINNFKLQSAVLLDKYGNGAVQHYQHENAITTYLWLRYPDKYYIYKFGEVKKTAQELEADYQFKKGAYTENLRACLNLHNTVSSVLQEDAELVSLFRSQLTETCYPDPELKTLALDVVFYISRYVAQGKSNTSEADDVLDEKDTGLFSDDWFPAVDEYHPGLTKEKWLSILGNKKIIGPVWGGMLAAFYEMGGAATCTQIAKKYNKLSSAISGYCTQLAKRIYKETQCPLSKRDDGQSRYWPILFQGKNAGHDVPGTYIWKLRPELMEALSEFDIMKFEWKLKEEIPEYGNIHYWWLNANPKIWSFANIGIGEKQAYTLYNDNGNKRRIFQNFLDAKTGDIIIGYESTPVKQIVAIGKVVAEQDGENLFFEKVEGLNSPIDYAILKDCPELKNMEYFQNQQGSLFKLTKDEYEFIMDVIRDDNPVAVTDNIEEYTKRDFLDEVYMTEKRYENLVGILRNKKNIILQGAPGVGKTFAARRLAWAVMGEKDDNRIAFVQFHQNYSYEDFMMGYKPVEDGFQLKYGIFYHFCQKAANQPDKDFFFIIDEINRGNISKIFGELLMLIEKAYRGKPITMAYNGLQFSVPRNLYIIGMMNTADRSLAMIDYALRRRFSFFEMEPGFDSEGFIRYQNALNNEVLNELVDKIKELNREIALDKSLGKGFCIGHSYFCGADACTDEWLRSIVDYDILPMLNEYWFDDTNKLQRWTNILQGVFQ